MNLALRDIRHKPGRFVLTCLGLSLLLGVVLSMIGIYNGLVADALALGRTPKADVWIVEAGTRGPFAEASRLPGDTREAVARVHGVQAAGAVTFQSAETTHAGRTLRLYVVGYELGRPGGPETIAEGRPITRSRYEMIVDRRTGLHLGDRVKLGRNTFTVVGMVEKQVASSGDPVVFMTLRDAQQLQFQPEPSVARREAVRGAAPAATDTVNAIVARAAPGVPPAELAAGIERWKHLSAMTQQQQEAILIMSLIEKARRQIGLFTTILLVVSAVVIALIVYTMTMDKLREIATLKLIGAPDRTIVSLILTQALAMGMIGFGVGTTLILLVKDYFPRSVVINPENALALGGIVVLVCVVASSLGVRLALKVDPATALGG